MDVMQMDAFAEIKNYAGRVCIVHGTKDKMQRRVNHLEEEYSGI
jgi:hypothetical protein